MQPGHQRAPSAPGAAPVNHFMSPQQADNVRQLLQQIDEQMIRNAQRIDNSLSTPYPKEQARADYDALLSQIAQLETATLPVSSIAFDSAALSSHAAAVAAASDPSGAIDGARFSADLVRMTQTLREECAVLQSHLAQVSAHTKSTAKHFRANKDAMMQGAVAAAQQAAAAATATAAAAAAAITPQQFQQAQMQHPHLQQAQRFQHTQR